MQIAEYWYGEPTRLAYHGELVRDERDQEEIEASSTQIIRSDISIVLSYDRIFLFEPLPYADSANSIKSWFIQ